MFVIDWVTCCCYMMLRKFHYEDWNAKCTAVVNSFVVFGFLFIGFTDVVLFLYSPRYLQFLYDYGKIRYVLSLAIVATPLFVRYYFFRKDAISLMEERIRNKGMNRGWLLFVLTAGILVASLAVSFIVAQYIKSQRIAFG